MECDFDRAFEFTLANEGREYTNDPRDAGGPTKYGVTLKAYQAHLGRLLTAEDIKNLTEDQAKEFYSERYWRPLKCDELKSAAIAICVFDAGVLYGVSYAAKVAQLAVSRCGATIKFDAIMGEKTVALLNVVREGDFIKAFRALLLERIDQIIQINPTDEAFRNGWTSRADRLLTLTNSHPVNGSNT